MSALKLIGILILAAWSLLQIGQPAIAEIPAGSNALTDRDFVAADKAFMTRTILETYLAHRNPQADKETNEALEAYLKLWIENCGNGLAKQDNTSLEHKGKQLADVGCDDPIFIYCHGRVLEEQGRNDDALMYLQQAHDKLPDSGYPTCYQLWDANHLSSVLRRLTKTKEATLIESQELPLMVSTITSGDFQVDEQRVLYYSIRPIFESFPIESRQKLVDAIVGNSAADIWLQNLLAGKLEFDLAWKSRGSGWAADVSKEGWKGYKEHAEKAHDRLEAAWKLNPQAPEPATIMIQVAMGGVVPRDESPRLWFDRAVSAQMDYTDAYSHFENALLPRWGGSHEAMYLFGRECLKTKRFDTLVPFQFLTSFQSVLNDIGSDYEIFKTPDIYQDFVELVDGYCDQDKEPNRHWYRSLKVGAAARCGKWDDARHFLDQLDAPPDVNALNRLGLKRDMTIGEIHARCGEIAGDTAEAEKMIDAGQFDDAQQKYTAILERAGDKGLRGAYLKKRLADVEFKRSFAADKWTAIPVDPQLCSWHISHGYWSVDDEGRLVGLARRDQPMIVADNKMGVQFEVRGVAELKTPEHNASNNFGIYFGRETGWIINGFSMSRSDKIASIGSNSGVVEKKHFDVAESTSFRVERWNDLISAYVDEQPVLNRIPIEVMGSRGGEVLALGGAFGNNNAAVRFSKLEARLLTEEPADMVQAEAAKEKEPKKDEGENQSGGTESTPNQKARAE